MELGLRAPYLGNPNERSRGALCNKQRGRPACADDSCIAEPEDEPSGHDEAEALLQQGLIRFTDEASHCDMLYNLGLLLSFQPSRLAGAEVFWRRLLKSTTTSTKFEK